MAKTDLEPFILQHLLDRNILVSGLVEEPRLEDDTEGAVAYDLAVGIGEIFLVARLAVRGDDLDDFMGVVDRCEPGSESRG